jgi:hypothetical protein
MTVQLAPQLFSPKEYTQAYADMRNRDQYFLKWDRFYTELLEL